MRILQLVAGEKWTGPAAVVFAQTEALVAAGVEAQLGIVSDSPLASRLSPLGWVRPVVTRPATPLHAVSDVRRLRALLLRERVDIVHAHTSHDHFLAAAATVRTGIRVARTIHHVRHARPDFFIRRLFAATDAFAFANSAIARAAARKGTVLPPVVDVARFRPGPRPFDRLRRLGVPDGAFVVGTVGKIARGRGYEEALEALHRAPQRACLVHVGKGDHRPFLERRAAELGVADRNLWAGYQEDDLPELYRGMDVLLFTASGSDQGQRAILEAMASALPVVALDLPGVRDLFQHPWEGLVAGDAAGLSAALCRLADSPELARELGTRARARARSFDGEFFAPLATRFYEELLASGATAPRKRP